MTETDYEQILADLFLDAAGAHKRVDRAAAREAGVPSSWCDTVVQRSARIDTPDEAAAAAKDLAETIADAQTTTTDPAELAELIPRTYS